MVTAQSEQIRRTNEGREEAAFNARVQQALREHRKLHPFLVALSAQLSTIDSTPTDPTTRRAAMSGPYADEWKEAELKEIKSLKELGTWELVIPPDGSNIITCKWVYKVKHNADGTIERFKARLVARGFQQIESIDYEETFAPTAKFVTIRIICALACSLQWPLEQCDIETAFLWATMDEDKPVYMAQPEGYVDPDRPHHVCLLKKSIYGLKQSPYLWTQLLAKELKAFGYRQLSTDMSCFVKSDELGTCLIISCYVDDLLIMGRTTDLIKAAISELEEKFKVKSLGAVSWILGIAAERNMEDKTFVLHQRKNINDMIKRYDLENAAPRNLPFGGGDDRPAESPPCDATETKTYRSLVGSLLYCAVATRADIVETVNRLCRVMHSPTKADLTKAKRCLLYLKGTSSLGLTYHGESGFKVYCDSNWASALDQRRSRSGWAILLNNAAIIFRTMLQKCQALSTAEAEYVALCAAAQDVCFLHEMLQELGMPLKEAIPVFEDNQACILNAIQNSSPAKLKHIDLRYHFTRTMIEANKIKMVYCPTYHQAADILTKPTDLLTFVRHRSTLMGQPATQPASS